MQTGGFTVGLALGAASRRPAAGGAAALDITVLRGTARTAPEGILFEAMPTGFSVSGPAPGAIYSPRDHDIHYQWSFSDPGAYGAPVNLGAGLNDRDRAFGRRVGHVFTRPGSHTVTCTATDGAGNSASASVTVQVKDPAAEYPGAQTICVALDGDFAGAPAGAGQYTTLAAALSAYQNLPGTGRLLLKRGESHPLASEIAVDGAHDNFHFGAWGSGPRPVLNLTAAGVKAFNLRNGYGNDFTLWGIRIAGGWDSTTETGLTGQYGVFNYNLSGRYTVSDCDFDGLDIAVYAHAATSDLFVNDCAITNWKEYGIFAGPAVSASASITGCRIAQHVDALAGSTGLATDANHHGPLRHSFKSIYLDCCDLFSKNGWSTAPGVVFADQPCIRHNTKVVADVYGYYTRTSCEGGWKIIAMEDASGVTDDLAGNCIWDGCYFLGTAGTDYAMSIQYSGTTVRNCIIVRPKVPRLVNGYKASFWLYPDGIDALNNSEPVRLYNNTCVDLTNEADNGGNASQIMSRSNDFTDIRLVNNIEHSPNKDTPLSGDAPLSATPVFTPRYKGFVWSGNPVLDTAYATPAASAADYRPLPGSAAVADADAGAGPVARRDFFGVPRGSAPSRGALEPG